MDTLHICHAVRSYVSGMATVELLLQTGGVWSHVPDWTRECFQRIIPKLQQLKVSVCLWSHTF